MEQNAPNHVIGTGSLEVKPEMQAVRDELAAIDKLMDALKEKGASLFDGMAEKVKAISEDVAGLVAKAAEIKLSLPSEPSPQAPGERRETPSVPAPDSPEADRRLDEAERKRWQEEVLERLNQLVALTEEDLNRDPD